MCYVFPDMERERGLSGSTLKLIACAFMLLDHIMKIFQAELLALMSYPLYSIISSFGTVAFFIFAYMVAEGVRYTRDVRRYLLRLLLFALASEVPFRLAKGLILGVPPFSLFGTQNVIFTFLYGVIACVLYDYFSKAGKWGYGWASVVFMTLLAFILESDYYSYGVLTVFLMYVVKERRSRLFLLSVMIFFFFITGEILPEIILYGFSPQRLYRYVSVLLVSQLNVLLLSFYNGRRGWGGRYFFYVFYPAHLLILSLLHNLIIF